MSKTKETFNLRLARAKATMKFEKTGSNGKDPVNKYDYATGKNIFDDSKTKIYSLEDMLSVINRQLAHENIDHDYSYKIIDKVIKATIKFYDGDSDDLKPARKISYYFPTNLFSDTQIGISKRGNKMMPSVQHIGSINTYLRRYTYLQAFCVSENSDYDIILEQELEKVQQETNYNNNYQSQNNYNNDYQTKTDFAPKQSNVFENNYNEQVQTNNEPAFIQNFKSTDPIPMPDEQVEEQPLNFGIEIKTPKVDVGITTDLVNQMQKVADSYGDASNTFNLETKQLTTRINAINKLILDGEITQLKVQNAIKKHNDAIIEGKEL